MFDLSGIPPAAHINSVTLTLQLTTGNFNAAETIELHTVQSAWGEGNSSGGSGGGAAPGGPSRRHLVLQPVPQHLVDKPRRRLLDRGQHSLAFNSSQPLGAYTWSGGTLAQDVQAWVNGTTANNGWLLLGNEAVGQTARRFGSRESTTPAARSRWTSPPCRCRRAWSCWAPASLAWCWRSWRLPETSRSEAAGPA